MREVLLYAAGVVTAFGGMMLGKFFERSQDAKIIAELTDDRDLWRKRAEREEPPRDVKTKRFIKWPPK